MKILGRDLERRKLNSNAGRGVERKLDAAMTHLREHSSLLPFLLHCFAFHNPENYLYVSKKTQTTTVGVISEERGYSNLLGQPFSHLPTFPSAQPFFPPPTMVPAATSRLLCLESDQEINALRSPNYRKLEDLRGVLRAEPTQSWATL